MMKNYSKDELSKMSNDELEKELTEHEYLHRDLLCEYDERFRDGRIKPGKTIKPEDLEEYFRKRREEKEKRQRKAS